jgi:predicted dehydrogenase
MEVKVHDVVQWGIIGCGKVTEVKSGPAFQKAQSSSLVAVMRRNKLLAEDYARRHQVPGWYDDAYALINDPEVDAVYIAAPPSNHYEYTLAAARAGKPVYVEKPMANSYKECIEMIRECEHNQVPLYTAYYRRALPRFLKVKSLLENGTIGDVRAISMTYTQPPSEDDLNKKMHWRIDPNVSVAGYFYEMACHMLDLMLYFLGPCQVIKGVHTNQAGYYDVPDMVSAVFISKAGVHGVGLWNYCANDVLDRTEIIGSKGVLTYATFLDRPIIVDLGKEHIEFNIENPIHIQQPLIQSIVDEILGKGTCPSTGITGAETNLVMDEILGLLIS